MNGEKQEEVTSFKHYEATLSNDGTSTAEVRIGIAMATAAMARRSRLWISSSINFPTKNRLCKSLVVSILLYGCETRTLHAEHDCNTCWSTRAPTGDRQTTKAGLVWTRHQTLLSVQDCSPGKIEGGRRRGRQKKSWMDNVKSG